MSRLIFEFKSDKERDDFLGHFSNSLEQDADVCFDCQNQTIHFDYKRAFPAWGWNGKGDPIVDVTVKDLS